MFFNWLILLYCTVLWATKAFLVFWTHETKNEIYFLFFILYMVPGILEDNNVTKVVTGSLRMTKAAIIVLFIKL